MADQTTPRRSRARTQAPTLEQPADLSPEPVVQAPAGQEPAGPGPSAPKVASGLPSPSEPSAAQAAPQEEDARPARTLSVRSPRVARPQEGRERESRPQEARSQEARPQEGRPQEGGIVRKEAGSLRINELRNLNAEELAARAEKLGIENAQTTRRGRLTQKIIERELEKGSAIFASGVFEAAGNGDFGFLRDPLANFAPGDDDIYVPAAMIRRNNLRTGDEIEIEVRPKGEQQQGGHHGKGAKRDDRLAAGRLISLHGKPPEASRNIPQFEDLTPLHPNRMMRLERPIKAEENITGRLIDLISPIGFGQRALLVAPPKSGKTVMMQHVAHAISSNHPDLHLIVLLVDERPEEVTEMIRSVKGEVFASTFDQPAASHVELAEMVIERAKRLVERKKDVVILLDSITRLARAYNTTAPSSGKILSGGVEANALTRPKRFFGAARNIEEGGSLTIVATALTDTGSRMDEVIYEEFKGTGNMEIHLERRMMEKRVYPAININRSGTRREELLLDASDLPKIWVLRKLLHGMDELAALEFMLDKLRDSKNNGDFMDAMRRG